MKTIVATLLFICAVNIVIAQKNERIIDIKEKRHPYGAVIDTVSRVHQLGDISVDRINMSADTNETAYKISLMIWCDKKLTNFQMNFKKTDNFDKVSYIWDTDSIVSITFINSTTHKKGKLKLIQLADERGYCSLGFIKDHSDDFFDE